MSLILMHNLVGKGPPNLSKEARLSEELSAWEGRHLLHVELVVCGLIVVALKKGKYVCLTSFAASIEFRPIKNKCNHFCRDSKERERCILVI